MIIAGLTTNNPCKDRISYKDIHINSHLDMDQLLEEPDSLEIDSTVNTWQEMSYESDDFKIIKESSYLLSRKLLLIEHTVNGHKHYGALILPKGGFKRDTSDLLIIASGLDQSNPVVNIDGNYWLQQMATGCEDMALLIPSFRGQSLKSGGNYYCSDGFFGDAFDGAAIDALTLLNVAETIYPTISKEVYVYGISRGATVAVLMAVRNVEIKMVVAQSGPYDFTGDYAYRNHSMQFKYQFLSRPMDKNVIRNKIISSSPIYFSQYVKSDVMIIHGKNDEVCSFSKAEEFYESFPKNGHVRKKWKDGGHGLMQFSDVIDQIKNHQMDVINSQQSVQ
ncbi:MAG: prolyl oligopeptidase family serine peptidase [Saprospiraceae bacterium]|nr:prolyl oligopeptidase family serine peptidase [Saprospiraceae bacterium]